jgi:hypothetical protein
VRTRLSTALSLLVLFDGGSWAFGAVPTLYYAFVHHGLPTIWGIRLLGGPFERLGLEVLIVVGLLFVVVSALKLLAAHWIWNTRKDGAILALILLGISTVFWYGFALPLGPTEGVPELVLIALTWNRLNYAEPLCCGMSPEAGGSLAADAQVVRRQLAP